MKKHHMGFFCTLW